MSLLCSKSLLSLSKSLKWPKYLPSSKVPHHLQGPLPHGFHLSWFLPHCPQAPLSGSLLEMCSSGSPGLFSLIPSDVSQAAFPVGFSWPLYLTIINSLPPHHSHFLSSSPLCVYQEYWMSLSHIWYILISLFICLFYFLHPALPLNISSKQARIFWVFSLLNAHCKDHEEIFVQ